MADYDIRWRLNSAPVALTNGSATVEHDFDIVYRVTGSGDPWEVVPGKSLAIYIPAGLLRAVLDMPDGPDKVSAYKAALIKNLGFQPIPIIGWANFDIDRHLQANGQAATEADRADTYILDLAGSYPVYFEMEV
jgi:hypothetical protein